MIYIRLLPLVLVLAGACVVAIPASAQNSPCNEAPPVDPEGSKTFGYSSKDQFFTVPQGVKRLLAVAEGAHGGQGHSTALGGAGGGAEAYVPVDAGDCLIITVGQYTAGSRSNGYTRGGAQGTTNGGGDGNSGASGGGSTGIFLGGAVLVGGGGGGAGGDGSGTYGGNGGNGGATAGRGTSGKSTDGGDGGCGACRKGGDGDGTSGGSAGAVIEAGSGGGGGGGFINGGAGGGEGVFNEGGGGGGAGATFVDENTDPIPGLDGRFISGRSCPRGKFVATCHGSVLLKWDQSASGTIAPDQPAVRLLSDDRDDILEDGLPISHSTSGGALRLELHIRGDGVKKPEVITTVESGPNPTTLELEPSAGAARRVADKRNVQLRLRAEHADGTTVQRLLLH